MSDRIYNFSSGPAVMPLPVLERARAEILSYHGEGLSVMEMSHRSPQFAQILEKSEMGLRDLLGVPANYRILFIQGGASLQFAMVPMNLLGKGRSADFVVTGAWGEKAVAEASRFGRTNIVYSSKISGFKSIPAPGEIKASDDADYLHYTSNETIDGVEFDRDLEGNGVPVVCDASSNILSKPIDIDKYGLIYAGAQKNIGPSGVTVVIVREDLLENIASDLPTMMSFRSFADHESMPNTPNTWAIYLIGLVCDWLKDQGGVEAISIINQRKAKLLYDAIDNSDGFYHGCAERPARSRMNVTFRLPSLELEEMFCKVAEQNGMSGLRGHRSVGGVRASIYNAFPESGVTALVDLMRDFADRNA